MSGAETNNSESDNALTQAGTLRIDSKPVAQVFVDGLRIGNTPRNTIRLQPGVHSLQLYNAEHVLLKDITLRVQPGETISRVEYFDR